MTLYRFSTMPKQQSQSSGLVVVHCDPGIAVTLPINAAPNYIAPYVLRHEVQFSDPLFERFVSISTTGVATTHAQVLVGRGSRPMQQQIGDPI